MGTGGSSSFAALLKRYRLAAGLTQEALAERARLSVRAISDLERGVKAAPRHHTIRLLAEGLALSPHECIAFEAAARARADRSPEPAILRPESVAMPAAVSEWPPALVGRTAELALIEDHLAGRVPPLLLLAGEPGIGKSRLLREARRRAVDRGWRVLEGGCQQRGGQEPFAPVLEALERHVQRQEPVELRTLLQGCAWLVRLLPELADGPIEPLPQWELTPAQERRLMFRAVARYLLNVATPAATLLVLDDLQWAGPDALDLLATLVRTAELPLRVVGAYRDTEVRREDPLAGMLADLSRAGLAGHRKLVPLGRVDAQRLLDDLLRGEAGGRSEMRERVLRQTEGLPFFLVSCAQALRAGELVGGIPWDVAEGIRQRTVGMPEVAREVLSTAAVIGRVVPYPLLARVSRRPEDVVVAACEAARRGHLLEEAGDDAYRFTHDMIREVLEGDLGAPLRRVQHRRVAEALEQSWTAADGRGTAPLQRLAYHYTHAGDQQHAVDYLGRAAERARRATANREEAELLGQALAIADQAGLHDAAGDLRARRGRAFFDLGRWEEARADLEMALASLPTHRREQRGQVLVDLAHVCHWLLDVPAQRRYALEAEALAKELDRRELEASALGALVLADSSDGDLESSLERARLAFSLVEDPASHALVPAVEMYALILYWRGEYEASLRHGREAVRIARQVNDTTYTVRALGNVGLALTGSGRYGEALDVFAEARQFAQTNETRQWLARATAMAGGLHLEIFDFAGAEALAEEARELGRSLGWPHAVISGGIDLLLNLARRGEVGERVERLLGEVDQAVATALGTHGWLWKLRLAEARAEIALGRGDWEAALRWSDEAARQGFSRGRVKYHVAGLTSRGRALAGLGRGQAALDTLRQAVDLARPTQDPAMFLRAAGPLLALAGEDQLVAEARAAVTRIAAALPDAELRRRFEAAEQVRAVGHGA